MVTRKGQASLLELPRESRAHLPRLPYSTEIPEGYDKALSEVFGGHGNTAGPVSPGTPQMPSPDRLKESQKLWDAAMAESILKGRSKTRAKIVLQMNGAMHSDSRYGIVDRLHRAAPRLKLVLISVKTDDAFPNIDRSKYDKIADFVIITPLDAKLEPRRASN
jgi:hypothetical protein